MTVLSASTHSDDIMVVPSSRVRTAVPPLASVNISVGSWVADLGSWESPVSYCVSLR